MFGVISRCMPKLKKENSGARLPIYGSAKLMGEPLPPEAPVEVTKKPVPRVCVAAEMGDVPGSVYVGPPKREFWSGNAGFVFNQNAGPPVESGREMGVLKPVCPVPVPAPPAPPTAPPWENVKLYPPRNTVLASAEKAKPTRGSKFFQYVFTGVRHSQLSPAPRWPANWSAPPLPVIGFARSGLRKDQRS